MKETVQLQVRPALISLDGYYVQELSFSLNADNASSDEFYLCTGSLPQRKEPMKAPQVIFNLEFSTINHKDDSNRFKCLLTVESSERDKKDEAEWYKFRVEIGAYFTLHESVTVDDKLELFYQQNAASIIYSIAREVIASSTNRSLFPGVVLPTIIFEFRDTELNMEEKQKTKKSPKNKRELLK